MLMIRSAGAGMLVAGTFAAGMSAVCAQVTIQPSPFICLAGDVGMQAPTLHSASGRAGEYLWSIGQAGGGG